MSENLTAFSVPLFPLGTVLYPGGLLPLQIFEVRYLDMIGKCHRSGSPFGVVTLTKGSEVRKLDAGHPNSDGFADEAFHPVGTLATITELSSPQPGLLVIRCTGTQRFRMASYDRLQLGQWFASAQPLDDDVRMQVPDDLRHVATALGNLINTLHARDLAPEQMPLLPPYQLDDCGWVANRWCELLPMALDQKHRMMALDSPLLRLELVSDLLVKIGIGK
jgi:Lon protease-like protein